MRKVFFAVVLVAASFGGGAVMNGPGLRWAQTMILSRLHPGEDGEETLEVDDEAKRERPKPPETIPAAPVPPLFADNGAKKPAASSSASKPDDLATKPPEPKAPPAAPDPKAPPAPLSASTTPDESKPVGFSDEPVESKSLRDSGVRLVKASAGSDRPLPLDTSEEPAPLKPMPIPTDDEPSTPPTGASAPSPSRVDPKAKPASPARSDVADKAEAPMAAGAGASTASATQGWAQIRRKMADLGVSRYGFDGEPTGKVRFHCIIPVAGRRAVAQHFEAEGNDEMQAAELALRRVALWRATENPKP